MLAHTAKFSTARRISQLSWSSSPPTPRIFPYPDHALVIVTKIMLKVLAKSKENVKAVSSGKFDPTVRLAVLKSRLFRAVCQRVCKGLLNRDRLLFALRLAQVTVC